MEGLDVAFDDVVYHDIFRGLEVGDSEFKISHLFYAYDTLFLGEWDKGDTEILIIILNFFFLIPGLRLNLQKSNIYGIGVDFYNIEDMVIDTIFLTSSISFLYLGLPMVNIGHVDSWKLMVQNFDTRLASWKVNLLSSGGRLTLTRYVLGSLSIYFFSVFKVPM